VGPREDGNASESPGAYRRLPAHDVWDLAVHHQAGDWAWRLGVRNLFNRVYSSTGYSETYYPMPGRQAHLALSWSL
jgi:outer membrane receptor protein involved in Fe transport